MQQWAVAMEYRLDNPCEHVATTLGRQRRLVRHMRALPHAEVAETARRLDCPATLMRHDMLIPRHSQAPFTVFSDN